MKSRTLRTIQKGVAAVKLAWSVLPLSILLCITGHSAEPHFHDAGANFRYRAEVADDTTSGSGSIVTLFANKRPIDHFHIPGDYVVVAVQPHIALYGDEYVDTNLNDQTRSIVAVVGRRFSGQKAWVTPVDGIGLPQDIVAGGNTAIVVPKVGTWGIQIYHIRNWPDIYAAQRYEALSISDGQPRWISNKKASGIPLWTDGAVFLSEWMDLSKTAINGLTNAVSPMCRRGLATSQVSRSSPSNKAEITWSSFSFRLAVRASAREVICIAAGHCRN